jgi:hypothetical protein
MLAAMGLRFEFAHARRSISPVGRRLAVILASSLAIAIDFYLTIILRRRQKEKFSAESFALTVIAQNPRVFERLAEM